MRGPTNYLSVITRAERRRPRRTRTPNVAGAALATLTVLGACTFGPAPQADATDLSPAEQQIANELPTGIDPSTCTSAPIQLSLINAVASLDCGPSSAPGGPGGGRYTLFVDQGSMASNLQGAAGPGSNYVPTLCTGATTSPSDWSYTATPNQIEGQILCGTFQNTPNIEWTRSSQLLTLDVYGRSDLDSLYKWWSKYGDPRSQGPIPNNAVIKSST